MEPCLPLYIQGFDYSPRTYLRDTKLNTTCFVCSKSRTHTETSDVTREMWRGGNMSQLQRGVMTPSVPGPQFLGTTTAATSQPASQAVPLLGGRNVTLASSPPPTTTSTTQHNKQFTPPRDLTAPLRAHAPRDNSTTVSPHIGKISGLQRYTHFIKCCYVNLHRNTQTVPTFIEREAKAIAKVVHIVVVNVNSPNTFRSTSDWGGWNAEK